MTDLLTVNDLHVDFALDGIVIPAVRGTSVVWVTTLRGSGRSVQGRCSRIAGPGWAQCHPRAHAIDATPFGRVSCRGPNCAIRCGPIPRD